MYIDKIETLDIVSSTINDMFVENHFIEREERRR
jgi:hypothetical protein